MDPALLWLWHRRAATALIKPPASELPHATDVSLNRTKNKQTKKEVFVVVVSF